MNQSAKSAIAAALVLVLSAAFAWLAGFDFDRRGLDVSFWVGGSVWCAFMAMVLVRLS